jgi:hypothetical protein
MSDMIPCENNASLPCGVCGAKPDEGCKNAAYLGRFNIAVAPAADQPKDINPKDAIGGVKFSLSLLPPAALAQLEPAFRDGAAKYGPANWRAQPVSARVYADAAFRHLLLWLCGQNETSDTGINHVAAAASNLMILLDAQAAGTLKDDRIAGFDPEALEDIFEENRQRNAGESQFPDPQDEDQL